MSDSTPTVNTQAIREAVDAYIAYVESDEYSEDGLDDYENAIFKVAVEAFRGPAIWEHISALMGSAEGDDV
jgi:hypothetical protein